MSTTRADLLLLRHGRTVANASGLLLGRADPPLDETGERQAGALAAEVCSGRFGPGGRVVTSPLARTRATAAAVSGLSGVPVEVDDRLVELDYGDLDGVAMSEVPAATWAAWRSDLSFRPPGGETLLELSARVRAACEDLLAPDRPAGVTVVVSHVSPIKAAAAWAMGVDDSVSWRMHLDPASITAVVARGRTTALTVFNDTAHLHA
ncbi:MAG: histidine phosphatase family protein [Actinomycetes bacterium]